MNTQYKLDGEPVKTYRIHISTNKGPIIDARIGGPKARDIIAAIVDILNQDDRQQWGCEE